MEMIFILKDLESEQFRKKVWYIINILQANQLFVHSSTLNIRYIPEPMEKSQKSLKKQKKPKLVSKKLPKILTLTILNALVPNSAMLLMGVLENRPYVSTALMKRILQLCFSIS